MNAKEFHKKLYKNIEIEIVKSGIPKTELAKKLKISNTNVSFILMKLKNGKSVSTLTLCKWADALGISVSNFFEKICN